MKSSAKPGSPPPCLPVLTGLHERHIGFYEPICLAYADAAALCLSRHHRSPLDLQVANEGITSLWRLEWTVPSDHARASWANSDDAVRDGAYAVAIATAEAQLGMFALSRAEKRTGADYYIGAVAGDLEDAFRLEVSGTELGGSEVEQRLAQKLDQAAAGASDLPAYACIVGFKVARVALAKIEME